MMKKTPIKIYEINQRLAAFPFPEVDFVIGIASGGNHPAKMISEILNKPNALIEISYRAKDNTPLYEEPILITKVNVPPGVNSILLVDDVSVSGKTMNLAKDYLKGYKINTFVLKGFADYVLFPEIKTCVSWPWHSASI